MTIIFDNLVIFFPNILRQYPKQMMTDNVSNKDFNDNQHVFKLHLKTISETNDNSQR